MVIIVFAREAHRFNSIKQYKARNIDILFTSPDTDNFIKLIYTMFGERNDNSPVKQIFIIDTRNSHGYKWCAKR